MDVTAELAGPQGALPVYLQIAEQIAREIAAGHLVPGDRLPPERALAARYDVALGTLRKALAELAARGHLERRQGSGNYVRASASGGAIYAFFRLELPQGGGLPTARLLSVDRMDKPADLPRFGAAPTAHRFRRTRYLDDMPAALEEIWLDGAAADCVVPAEVSQSLYQYYKDRLGLWIARAEDWVSVARMPSWGGAPALEPGAACGYVERLAWAQTGEQIEYSRTWFDPLRVRYVARLK